MLHDTRSTVRNEFSEVNKEYRWDSPMIKCLLLRSEPLFHFYMLAPLFSTMLRGEKICFGVFLILTNRHIASVNLPHGNVVDRNKWYTNFLELVISGNSNPSSRLTNGLYSKGGVEILPVTRVPSVLNHRFRCHVDFGVPLFYDMSMTLFKTEFRYSPPLCRGSSPTGLLPSPVSSSDVVMERGYWLWTERKVRIGSLNPISTEEGSSSPLRVLDRGAVVTTCAGTGTLTKAYTRTGLDSVTLLCSEVDLPDPVSESVRENDLPPFRIRIFDNRR